MTVPGVVRKGGVIGSAANIDKGWIGTDADDLLSDKLGREVHVINDADAAGLAEAATASPTAATGWPSSPRSAPASARRCCTTACSVPNSELGHLEIEGHDAESRAANSARKNEDLSWEKWAKRLTTYYRTIEKLFSPDLIVVGGGVSKHGPRVHPADRDRHRDHLRDPAQHRRHRRRRRPGGRQAERAAVEGRSLSNPQSSVDSPRG